MFILLVLYVEVYVEIRDDFDTKPAPISLVYDSAEELYQKGLLIYLLSNNSSFPKWACCRYFEEIYDRYIYFVSGKDTICLLKKADSSEWSIIESAPSIRRLPQKYDGPEAPYYYSGWKENDWVMIKADGFE